MTEARLEKARLKFVALTKDIDLTNEDILFYYCYALDGLNRFDADVDMTIAYIEHLTDETEIDFTTVIEEIYDV